MAYNSLIPQPTDVKSQSQSQILDNFTALSPFGNGFADFTVKTVAPTITAGDTGLYTLNNATTAQNEMYIRKQSVDAPIDIPFTASSLSYKTMANSNNGWTYLPSGVLVVWGRKISGTGASVAITPQVDSGCPNFNVVFRAFAMPQEPNSVIFNCGVGSASAAPNANFTAYLNNPSATSAVLYLVIGV